MPWRVKNPANPIEQIQCSLVPRLVVYFEPLVQTELKALMKEYPSQEWCGYLVGKVIKDGILVEELSIPPHESVSATHALAEPFHQPPNTVGFIHSHHHMGAFHSGQDAVTVDKNYPVSITVADKGQGLDFSIVSVQQTPCGRKLVGNGVLKFVNPVTIVDKTWLEQAKANIDKPSKKLPVRVVQQKLAEQVMVYDVNGHVVPKREELIYLKPITVDRQGNLRDKHGHFAGKNEGRILNPLGGVIYYVDEHGSVFTQHDIDLLREKEN